MKKLVLFFLLISITAKAQLNFVESHPADGAVNVQIADTISVSFSSALDTSKLTSGIYFYQLKAGSNIQVKKMMLLK